MSRKWLGLGPPMFKNINLRPVNNWNFNIYKKKNENYFSLFPYFCFELLLYLLMKTFIFLS